MNPTAEEKEQVEYAKAEEEFERYQEALRETFYEGRM
jgi:hypothetical protein